MPSETFRATRSIPSLRDTHSHGHGRPWVLEGTAYLYNIACAAADKLFIQQMRTQLAGALKSLRILPLLDKFRIAAQKHIRHFPPVELSRPRIDRRRQQIVLERIRQRRSLIGQSPRNQPDNLVRKQSSRNLPAAHHIISDRNLHRNKMFADTVVNPLVMSAKNNQILTQRKPVGNPLGQSLAVR